jgi:SHS family lactate transporter-like MFS transporter
MTDRPWYRQVNADQWKAFWAAYLGWMLDGFDFTIIAFLLTDIQRSFGVNNAMAGAVLTASLLFRVVGGAGAGTAADRWGRKGPLIFSILWYSFFAFLGGFSTSYGMLIACRALFGIGMGGVWAAGMPLALEHWPAKLRGLASGLLQGGYAMGYILSALVYEFVYPLVRQEGDLGWRVLLLLGILPSLVAVWIGLGVKESPVWLERQRQLREGQKKDAFSLGRLFQRDLLPVTLHSILLMASLLFLYNSIWSFYPRWLVQMERNVLPFLVAFNVGGILGGIAIGRASETALGRRGASGFATVIGLASIPLYLFTSSTTLLLVGAFSIGFFGTGNFGVVPGYLSERFPTAARAVGAGFSYQAGAALASFAATLIGAMIDRGVPVANAMAICIASSGVVVLILLWLGPETRGREFRATEN